ncbi:hypothetical protein [Sulfuricurvum sp.]|uniref:hypothetical protein n=1 Tax=Sulfuricurvum sp. TaxID=2025608 RepID=UPI003BB0F536
MTVASYLFQSPYSSPVQIGRKDPLAKEEVTSDTPQNAVKEKASVPQETKANPALSNKSSISLTAFSGTEGKAAADTFNAVNTKVQAQSVYQNS